MRRVRAFVSFSIHHGTTIEKPLRPPIKHGRRVKHGRTDACAATVDRPRLSPQFFASGVQKRCEVCTLDLGKYVFYNT